MEKKNLEGLTFLEIMEMLRKKGGKPPIIQQEAKITDN